jgi:hypothetical protein
MHEALWGPFYERVSLSRSPGYFGYCGRRGTVVCSQFPGSIIRLSQLIVVIGIRHVFGRRQSVGYEGEKNRSLIKLHRTRMMNVWADFL